MNVDQAFEILKENRLTENIQTVRRWIRNGEIKAHITNNRKAGYIINEDDLNYFISSRNPLSKEINRLNSKIRELEETLEEQEPKIVPPEDYDKLKGGYEAAQRLRDRYKEENKQLREELKKASVSVNATNDVM